MAKSAFRKSGALCSREHPSIDRILFDCAALWPKLDANWNLSGEGQTFLYLFELIMFSVKGVHIYRMAFVVI